VFVCVLLLVFICVLNGDDGERCRNVFENGSRCEDTIDTYNKKMVVKSGDVLSAEFDGTYVHAAVTL
jgi:hypothetical protein